MVDTANEGSVLAVCGLAFEAAIAAAPGVVTACAPGGAGPDAAVDALLDALLDAQPQARPDIGAQAPGAAPRWAGVISFGCAGGLDPDLAAGTCVLATGVHTPDGYLGADAAWLHALARRLPAAVAGELAGADAPLLTAADKAWLWRASGACAVDTESHAAARAARRHRLPFAACRVVLDPAGRDVPASALAGLRADRTVALLALAPSLLHALMQTPRELGSLGALAVDAYRARRGLRRARRRLGAALALPYRVGLAAAPPLAPLSSP